MKIFLFILSYFFHSYNGETQILCTFQAAFAGIPPENVPLFSPVLWKKQNSTCREEKRVK